MRRYGEAARSHAGLRFVTTLRDSASGDLVGLAVWESPEAAQAATPALHAAVKGDDFDAWVAAMRNFRLEEA